MTAPTMVALTPSKITAWLDCPHYLTLRDAVDHGTMDEPSIGLGPFAELLAAKGLEHEHAYLEVLAAQGLDIHAVPPREHDERFGQWAERVEVLLAAGHDALYQFPLVHDGVRGVADFLVRVDEPSKLGSFRYEPVDAKLARAAAKPGHVLQLCFYAEALGALQGASPGRIHLHLGSGHLETIRLADVQPYWRRLRDQLRRLGEAPTGGITTPVPCDHCQFCEFATVCEEQWRAADSLQYVAGIRANDIAALGDAGVTTAVELSARRDPVAALRPDRLGRLRRQAALQRESTGSGPPAWEGLGLVDVAQRDRLPAPDDADVFLDFEGHPFWTPADDLFFLFGVLHNSGDGWNYEARWAHDLPGEAREAASLIDWLAARHAAHPGMHVYHYNHTEKSSLLRLAATRGIHEHVLASMVDNGVFVDVLDVVRHAVLVGVESYGLKHVESLTGFARRGGIDVGAGAVVEYDAWTRDSDDTRLERIARYNEDDVRATLAVRDWLVNAPLADVDWRDTPTLVREDEREVDEVVAALVDTGEQWKVLLAQLLEYWAREGRAHKAQHLALLAAGDDDRLDHPEVLTGLELIGLEDPTGRKKVQRARFSFPDQTLGDDVSGKVKLMYPAGPDGLVVVDSDGADLGLHTLTVAWNEKAAAAGLVPSAMVLDDWVTVIPKPDAVHDVASCVAKGSADSIPAIARLLARDLPRFTTRGGPAGDVFTADVDDIVRAAATLDHSVMAVQGPPGTGKTFTGAQIIRRLVADGKRVGVTANSHAAIDNLLRECLRHEPDLRVLRQTPSTKGYQRLPELRYGATRDLWDTGAFDVVAGSSWCFAREDMRSTPAVDVLIIDEAGQFALADAVASMGGARSAILLGDPLQLAQVSQALHPDGAGASVLEHLLGDDATMPVERGAFLEETRRMHPAVCAFISDQIYEGRLRSHPDCARQSVGGEAGLRRIRAVHHGCSTSSPEEATIVAATVRELLGRTWIDMSGRARPLEASDVMVVAPYNDQVDLVRAVLDADDALRGARVGTVDKFQGQEAPVVIFTMATSGPDDLPRTTDFLFSRHRLNVAVSRARALAYVVCTDELLDTRARTVEEMRLIATLCAFVDAATP